MAIGITYSGTATADNPTLSTNDDTALGLGGNDTLLGLAGNDLLDGGEGDDWLEGGKGRDTVLGGAGNDTLTVYVGDMGDQLEGGLGNDIYNLFEAGSTVIEAAGAGRDTLSFGYSNQKSDVVDNIEVVALNNSAQRGQVLTLNDSDTGHDIYGRAYDADVIYGNGGDDKIHGNNVVGLQDTVYGGAGNDTYSTDNATDILVELAGEGDADQIEGYYRNAGGTGVLNVQLQDNIERLYILNEGRDVNAKGTQQADLIHGFNTANVIDGQGGNDSLYGGRGQDELIGGSGDDTLNAGWYYQLSNGVKSDIFFGNHPTALIEDDGSVDTLRGGTGDDRYMLFSNADAVVELAGEGTDTVVLHNVLQHNLADNIENLEAAVASGQANLNGNALGNRITAGAFNDTVSGLDGNDTLLGLDGNDELRGGEGNDSLDGGRGMDTLLGGAGDDLLNGSIIEFSPNEDSVLGTVNDGVLSGDRLEGGQGDDIYVIDSVRDIVVELANEGRDTVRSHVNLDLGTLANVEAGELLGDRNLTIKGNAQGNQLVGNRGDNQLDGAGGADTLIGGAGNDTYVVDSLDDVVVELGAADSQGLVTGGADTVITQLDGYTLGSNVENLRLIGTAVTGQGNALDNILTGNAQANVLRGDDGDDVLDGQAGADTLEGGNGNDAYHVDNAADRVVEAADGGRDVVVSSVSFSLQDLAAVEDLTLTNENTTGQGNAGNNWLSAVNVDSNGSSFGLNNTALYGLAGDDTLVGGGTSSNKLYGGQGNDTYFVIGNTQSIVELAGEGTDTVWVSRYFGDYRMADNVENAFVSADYRGFDVLAVIGNGLANQITGSFNRDSLEGGAGDDTLKGGLGNDTLSGGSGNDSMVGGLGDDTYVVDSLNDVVVERSREGTDTVISKLAGYTLGANVERLLFDLTGTAGNDLLLGGTLEDTLNGGAGADTLVGGKGNDTYLIDNQADVITELANEGIDTAQSSVSYALGQGLENLTLTGSTALNGTGNSDANLLTGNSGSNRLEGQDGADTLDGGAGVDTLLGGAGNDTYLIDNLTDVITEFANEGVDTVQSSVGYTLSGNVENLTLTGTAALNGTGSATANLIQGNSGNNRLDGQGGADTLVGGAGNDTYVVDNAQDVVTEFVNEGIDTVEASASYSLSDHIENLTLTGNQTITGSGNSLHNQIKGNGANNALFGNGGNDTLDGGAGNDTLDGGADNDTYVVDSEGDLIVEDAAGGYDQVNSSVSYTLQVNVEKLTLTGSQAITGSGNGANNRITGNGANNKLYGNGGNDALDGGAGDDTMDGGVGHDTYVVDSANDVIIEAANGGYDQVTAKVSYTLQDNIEALYLDEGATGPGYAYATFGIGNVLNNYLQGNSGANFLDGSEGNDTLDGNGGEDTLVGGAGEDWLYANQGYNAMYGGEGNDVYQLYLTNGMEADVGTYSWDGSQDVINLWGWSDQGNDLQLSDLKVERVQADQWYDGDSHNYYGLGAGTTVALRLQGQSDSSNSGSVYINLFNEDGSQASGISEIRLNGTTLSFEAIKAMLQTQGTTGNDTLFGFSTNEQFDGGLGNDYIDGAGGNDTLLGGEGNDDLRGAGWLDGGAGNDYIRAIVGSVASTVRGGAGNDFIQRLWGESNTVGALIDGGAGNDQIYLAKQDTVLFRAGDGIDHVSRADSSNTFRLEGLKLSDLQFGRQAAVYYSNSSLTIAVNGQVEQNQLVIEGFYGQSYGTNQNIASLQGRIEVLNEAGTGYVTLDASTLQQLANVGNDLNNLLTGDAGNNAFDGGLGQDTLNGGAGNDSLRGGEGSDQLMGGAGNDELRGDAGDDWLSDGAGNDLLEGGAGNDYITDWGGNNTLSGGDGNDYLSAGAGNDLLMGGAGSDQLWGGTGSDTLMGGAGSDTYFGVSLLGADQTRIVEEGPASDANVLFLEANVYGTLFRREGDDLVLSSMASSGRLTVRDWFLGGSQQLDTISIGKNDSDYSGYTGGTVEFGDVDVLVQAMASFTPAAGATEFIDPGLRGLIEQTLSVYTEIYPN